MRGARMLLRHKVFWGVLIIVFAALILLILSIAVFEPKPEPISLGKTTVLPLPPISTVAAITAPAQETPVTVPMPTAGQPSETPKGSGEQPAKK